MEPAQTQTSPNRISVIETLICSEFSKYTVMLKGRVSIIGSKAMFQTINKKILHDNYLHISCTYKNPQ